MVMTSFRSLTANWLNIRAALPLSILALSQATVALASDCAIMVSRNRQVTDHEGEGSVYVFEPSISVNPKDERNIVVGVTAVDPARIAQKGYTPGRAQPESWFTKNGGRSWKRSAWPKPIDEVVRTGIHFHSIVIFGGEGEVWATFDGDSGAPLKASTRLLMSRDGGATWPTFGTAGQKSRDIPGLESLAMADQSRPALDATNGPHKGTLYLTTLGGLDNSVLLFARSPNDGIWRNTVVTSSATLQQDRQLPHDIGLVVPARDLLISRDGRLIVPLIAYQSKTSSKNKPFYFATSWLTSSVDGGLTFSKPQPVVGRDGKSLGGSHSLFERYAIDSSGGPFSATIYRTWPQFIFPVWKLFLSQSTDGGQSWAEPKVIEQLEDPDGIITKGSYGEIAPQTQSIVSVNAQGVVMLSWYRLAKGTTQAFGKPTYTHRRFVTASVDGGKTFLPPSALASVVTTDFLPPNTEETKYRDPHINGDLGHYMRVEVDPSGAFHHAWLDGRTGKQELWYANARILCGGKTAVARLP